MDREEFEAIVEKAFENLPEHFKKAIDNVRIIVDDYPSDELVASLGIPSRYTLLGLYQGVPIPSRGTWYGMTPVPPDTISLYQKNIESHSGSHEDVKRNIYETLVHEIGHYFGMSEDEVRAAGY